MESLLIWLGALAIGAGTLVPYLIRFRRDRREAALRRRESAALGLDKPLGQYPLVDANACIGCGTCVAACPEGDVLGIVSGRAVVINGARCIGHGKCAEACPVGAIRIGLGDIRTRDDIPLLDEDQQTSVPGIYICGELSGFALISNAIRQGERVAGAIARDPERSREPDLWDVVIVGAGPAGMSAALTASREGLRCIVLDQQGPGGTILQYPRHKLVMVQPVTIPCFGTLDREEYSKEELLEIWRRLHRDFGLDIRHPLRVTGVTGQRGDFTVETESGERFRGRRVVLALGRRGTPRRLDVPGEELPHVTYKLIDAAAYRDRRVLVVGGGDSAVEAALGLSAQAGTRVTLSYRKPAFLRVKKRNAERIERAIADGRITFLPESTVQEITPTSVALATPGGGVVVPADNVLVLIGGIPPFALLHGIGIRFGGEQQAPQRAPVHAAS